MLCCCRIHRLLQPEPADEHCRLLSGALRLQQLRDVFAKRPVAQPCLLLARTRHHVCAVLSSQHGAFYVQITKIAVAPAVLVIEFVLFGRTASLRVVAAILLVCAGVGLSTLTDVSLGTTGRGLAVGAAAVAATAMYQVLRRRHHSPILKCSGLPELSTAA